jgi:nucleoside-diphosphate-sugar epimerase
VNSRQLEIIKKDCSELVDPIPEHLLQLKNEHILVTGGSGFMGSWLCELVSCLNETYSFNTKVTVISNNTDVMISRSPHLFTNKLISLKRKNVCDLIEIPEDVTWIIHAAATPDNRVHSSDPLRVVSTIIDGTRQVLDSCLRLPNLKKIVNISSGLIYGQQSQEIPQISEEHIGGPNCSEAGTSAYAEAKRMGESICSIYKTQFRLPIVNLRPFAFIGPYQLVDRPWAINNFINDAFSGGSIKILGDQNTVRSYMYPSDMAYWILGALVKGKSGSNYNLGSSEGHTLGDVANIVANCFPGKIKISFPSSDKARHSIFVPDTSNAEVDLDLKLTVNLLSAIENTVNWLKQGN